MSAADTMQQTPAVPPRPTRSSDNNSAASMPLVPPRPASKRNDRSVSPNSARFAPSPFTEGIIAKPPKGSPLYSHHQQQNDPIERTSSRGMPSVGEEGAEYDNVSEAEQFSKRRSLSPEQTRTIGEDIKLHAPKPSLPALSAKQRVQAVTRTDSDRAAQYGLGRPRSRPTSMHEDPAERTERASSRHSMKKKPSTSFSTHSDAGNGTDDEHGIPQFGHRVPMNPHLGDVQAPSPAAGSDSPGRHHHRKGSSRSLPPGSYGMHGHGMAPQDKLEKAYYQKHPELVEKEQHHHHLHERQNDFAMSSSDLNKLVRETAHRGQGVTPEYRSTPTDEVGFQATEEYTSRISSPRPASATPKDSNGLTSPLKQSFQPDPLTPHDEEKTIHVDDARHPEYRSYGDEDTAVDDEDHEYTAPILAADEVQKDPNAYMQRPAVAPVSERRGSSYEGEDPPSRPTSRPSSLYNTVSHEYHNSTPLEDVEEYEPLFTEEEAKAKEKEIQQKKAEARRQHHFPSKDIWEDAPSSVHFTTEVSTPDVPEPKRRKSSAFDAERPQTPAHVFAQQQEERAEKEARAGRPEDWSVRDEDKVYRADSRSPLKHRTNSHGRVASPAHAFAQRQEELAEKEANHGIRPEDWSSQSGASWRDSKPHLATHRTGGSGKFPSRDIWEDTPESAMHVATVSASPPKPDIPARPAKKLSSSSTDRPAIPDRPKPRQDSGDDATKPRPPVSDKPKPQVPVRPVKSSSGDSAEGAAKQKPPVPSRPVGGKIAALQAGFMSDLNKRLKIGPQIPVKKEEQEEESAAASAETEKAPLSDARKSRARGPQRRAPAKSPAPAAEAPKQAVPTFTFTMAESSWSIDPEEGNVSVVNASDEKLTEEPAQIEEPLVQAPEIEDDGVPGKVDVPEPEAQAEVPIKSESSEPEVESGIPKSEPAIEPVETEPASTTAQAAEETAAPSNATDAQPTQMKTLVANTAGESVLETEVEKKGGDTIEPVSVQDTPKDL